MISGARFLAAFASMTRNPNQLDRVFRLIDGIDANDDEGLLDEIFSRPDFGPVASGDIPPLSLRPPALRRLPAGSLGRELISFLDERGLDPESLKRQEAPQTAFDRIRVHLQRSHDLWHVLTGFGTDVASELGLQAFYGAQFDSPAAMAIITAGFLNGLLFEKRDISRRLEAVALGWQMGKQAKSFVGVDWTSWLDKPLEEVRAHFAVDPAQVENVGALEKGTTRIRAAA
nr:Coq4 family protein [Pseudenhygromyxa sp. WMMC2535]